jgi:hypothetical protein
VAVALSASLLVGCSNSPGNTPLPDEDCPHADKLAYCNAKLDCGDMGLRKKAVDVGLSANATAMQVAERYSRSVPSADRRDTREGCLAGFASHRSRTS